MTKEEIEIIKSASVDTPFRVLTTTDEQDAVVLRRNNVDIEDIEGNKNLRYFIERLKLTLEEEDGVGIAAPQIGINRNLLLFMRMDKPEQNVQVAINPKITAHSDEIVCFERDGCLSIPGFSGNSKRYAWVDVEYRDENNILIKERLTGYSRQGNFTGVIFQHEFDHLQGILFIDKLCQEE